MAVKPQKSVQPESNTEIDLETALAKKLAEQFDSEIDYGKLTMITTEQKTDLWEKLHDCYSVTNIAARALIFEDPTDKSNPFPNASYATALERVSRVLLDAIAMLDNLPDAS